MSVPVVLRSPKKGLINIKNRDQKCFLWCHFRHINPSKEYPERIRKMVITKKFLLSILGHLRVVNLAFL